MLKFNNLFFYFRLHVILLCLCLHPPVYTVRAEVGVGRIKHQPPQTINWDEVDDLPPEWDTGLDDLLSVSTTYWEPGLGPRNHFLSFLWNINLNSEYHIKVIKVSEKRLIYLVFSSWEGRRFLSFYHRVNHCNRLTFGSNL